MTRVPEFSEIFRRSFKAASKHARSLCKAGALEIILIGSTADRRLRLRHGSMHHGCQLSAGRDLLRMIGNFAFVQRFAD
ncbi:hypothetical protein FHS25_000972 [Rhizobium laguerreae]|uniref:Uncharacterized protein n=1 Tax=Rhizobium laguerreae TaxID=1076926 RepID=A0ABR6G2P2_9HYPH|nr:hypothetical protein [Rhizobium laguerreae]